MTARSRKSLHLAELTKSNRCGLAVNVRRTPVMVPATRATVRISHVEVDKMRRGEARNVA